MSMKKTPPIISLEKDLKTKRLNCLKTFFTEKLKKFIEQNKNVLKGVFLTRKTSKRVDRIWKEWLSIKAHCEELKITVGELPSPSPRGGGVRDKINEWRNAIRQI